LPFSALRFHCSGANFDLSGPIPVQYLLREDTGTRPETRVNRVDQGLGAGVGHVGVEPQSRGDAGMAEHRGDDVRRLTVLQGQRGGCVP
jgi:hypothetical protein